MKTVRQVLALIFLMTLVLSLGATAFADDYLVRVYAGNKGDIGGSDVYESTVTYAKDAKFSFSNSSVNVTDDKYYVRGIRPAGLDNSTVYGGNTVSIAVTEDADYVVAYGILSNAVRYTVNYVSTGGNTLAPSETFYGNVGDKPVVAHVYVEGYQPQAYNLTKTLAEDEGSNVFTFTYSPAGTTTTEVVGGGGGAAVLPAAGAAAQQGGAGAAAQPAAPAPAQPEEIIDLDTPLAGPEAEPTAEPTGEPEPAGEPEPTAEPTSEPEPPKDTKLSSWVPYVLGLGGVALLSAFLVALNKRKKTGGALTHADMEDALKEAKEEVDSKNKK